MINKIYEFDDKHYCDKDLSETDPVYAGDLNDMWDAMCESKYFWESTFYCTDEHCYESERDCIEDCCDVVGEVEE